MDPGQIINERYKINDFTTTIANALPTFRQQLQRARTAEADARDRLAAVQGTGREDSDEFIAREDVRRSNELAARWAKRVKAAEGGMLRITKEEYGDPDFSRPFADLIAEAYRCERVAFE